MKDNLKITDTTIPSTIPKQKLSTSKKGEDWCKDNLLYWEQRLVNNNKQAENSKINMKRNSELYYNNVLNRADIEKICNPNGIGESADFVIPPDFRHYKIENPKIQTLMGEEIKRKFEWKVYVSNRDAISQKEEQKKSEFFNFLVDKIKADAIDEESLQAEMIKINEYLAYDWQEIREKTADELLHHFNQYLDLKTEFSKAWEYSLINGEEIMCIDEHNGKPTVKACDPKTVYWQDSGTGNNYIDDSDAIVEVYYLPMGQVVDYYYDFLKPSDVDALEARQKNLSEYRNFTYNQYYTKTDKGFIINPIGGEIEVMDSDYHDFYDAEGNIRIVHCRWKSLRKVGELTYFDDNGDEQVKHVDENYKINESLGETIKWLWITEAWENTRIGDDIFVKGKPRSVQFRKLDNISYCSLGYVGTSLKNGIFDLMKNYSIQFDTLMYRTNKALYKSFGRIGKLDLSLIPDGWNLDVWMHYATEMGWAVVDSFKEGKKGAALGKLAGQSQTQGDVINMEQGNFIQQNMQMLQFVEGQLDKLVGINQARQGITSSTSGLQLNREAIQASSNITESYFTLHDNVKLRTLRALLEVAKYCLRNKTESIQYITSDMSSKIFEVDGELINEAEFGILIGSASDDARMIESLQEAVKIALQTGAVDLIQLMDVFSSDNTSSIKRKIEKSVREKQEREQAQIEQQSQIEQARLQQEAKQHQELLAEKQLDRDMEQYKVDREFEKFIQGKQIDAAAKQKELDLNNNGTPDYMEVAKTALEQQNIDAKRFAESSKAIQKNIEIQTNKELESRKLDIEEKKIEADLENQKNDLQIAKIQSKNKPKK